MLHRGAFALPGRYVADTVFNVATRTVDTFVAVVTLAVSFDTFSVVIALVWASRVLAVLASPRRLAVAHAFDANTSAATVVAAFFHITVRPAVSMEALDGPVLQNFSVDHESSPAIVAGVTGVAVAFPYRVAHPAVVAVHWARFEPAIAPGEALFAGALSVGSVADSLAAAFRLSRADGDVAGRTRETVLARACSVKAGTVPVAAAWAAAPVAVLSQPMDPPWLAGAGTFAVARSVAAAARSWPGLAGAPTELACCTVVRGVADALPGREIAPSVGSSVRDRGAVLWAFLQAARWSPPPLFAFACVGRGAVVRVVDAGFRVDAEAVLVAVLRAVQALARLSDKPWLADAGPVVALSVLCAPGLAAHHIARHAFPPGKALAGPVLAFTVAKAVPGALLLAAVLAGVAAPARALSASALSKPAAHLVRRFLARRAGGRRAGIARPFRVAEAGGPGRGALARAVVAAVLRAEWDIAGLTLPVVVARALPGRLVAGPMSGALFRASLDLAVLAGKSVVAVALRFVFVALSVGATAAGADFVRAVDVAVAVVAAARAAPLAQSLVGAQAWTHVE